MGALAANKGAPESRIGGWMMPDQRLNNDDNGHLKAILDAVEAVLEGRLDQEVRVDAQGIVAHLAGAINKIILNLRTAHPNLNRATKEAPALAYAADSVASLMAGAVNEVLSKSDQLLELLGELESTPEELRQEKIKQAKALVFDIISSQSYQDRARQELGKLEKKLEAMRDALLKVLLVMNLHHGDGDKAEHQQKLLEEVKTPDAGGPLSQDLVDELLAEFGL